MSAYILEMKNITKTFPGVIALNNVSLQVKRGEIHALVGENGAGKSTLMKVLNGVYQADSGEILIDGQTVKIRNTTDAERLGIGLVFQECNLVNSLSVAENMFLNKLNGGRGLVNWKQINATTQEFLDSLCFDFRATAKIEALSASQKQMVEIAKAVSYNAKVIVFDEPTSSLTEEEVEHLFRIIAMLKERGCGIIYISHKMDEILRISDEVTVMRDGRWVATRDAKELTMEEIIRLMVGRSLENRYPDKKSHPGEVKFEVKDWWVRHPLNSERFVCKGSSINVRAGEVVGLAGLMGAGRTELARSVFGHSYGIHEGGEVFIDGKKVKANSVPEAIDAGIAYLSEDRKMLGLNLLELIHQSVVSAKLSKIRHHGALNIEEGKKFAEESRQNLRIKAPSVMTGVGTLSGGNQQKVVLAKWMFTDPEVLILDEPTRGIDVGAKYEIYTFIQELAAQGKAVLVISSELPELLGITDRIYTIFEGEVTGCVPTEQADQESLMHLMTSTSSTPTGSNEN